MYISKAYVGHWTMMMWIDVVDVLRRISTRKTNTIHVVVCRNDNNPPFLESPCSVSYLRRGSYLIRKGIPPVAQTTL